MQLAPTSTNEFAYSSYQDRQYNEINHLGLERRARNLSIGRRANWNGETWTPAPYPGYAMQAMLSNSSNAKSLSIDLQDLQYEIMQLVPRPGTLYALPASSFHQTVANTFSEDRLQRHLIDTGLYSKFPSVIQERMQIWSSDQKGQPPAMRLIGISLFRTAIGILGVFENEADFQRIIGFRNHFYQDGKLATIGLKRTRPFIGHVTLAYVEDSLEAGELQKLTKGIDTINQSLRNRHLVMELPFATLHRYENLSEFVSQTDYPTIAL